MIDEYYEVAVERISPEAPVPVMRSNDDKPKIIVPGGAANVACQFKNWNVECQFYGLANVEDYMTLDNQSCRIACGPLDDADRHGYIPRAERIPRKKRFENKQNLVRWDIEEPKQKYKEEDFKRLLEAFEKELKKGLDLVILSDYNKGFFDSFQITQEIITLCHTYGVKSIVDPKNEPIEKWTGCSIFKPNFCEAKRYTNVDMPEHQAQILAEKLGGSDIVITRGGEGVNGMHHGGKTFKYVPQCYTTDAQFYSGAGDCFAAFFALAIAHAFSLTEASEIAYKAGANYVRHPYNQPIFPYELVESKFIAPQDLTNRDFKLVATNGCFDLLHAGHLASLEFAKSRGDKLVVLINSDESVKKIKGDSRPIVPLEQRKKLISGLECVDYVIDFKEESPYNLIQQIRPDVLVKGNLKREDVRSARLVKEYYSFPLVEDISTSQIIKKINES
jgi:D-beta-D-heptose 7-phosphate kinase/D-beta-D-heptose 1-phosphate adenosyltransferase